MRRTPTRRLAVEQLEDRSTPTTLPAGFHETPLAAVLSGPTAMEMAPDGRIFVTQQTGAVRVIDHDELQSAPFLTLSVDSTGERGLLGIAFDPNFAANHYVYVYYTVPGSPAHNRVSRFTANGDVAVPGSEAVLMDLDPLSSATNHNGGALHFGTDGKLYIGVGENGNGANSQTLANRLGKVLRINSDGTIPGDNPFVGVARRAAGHLGARPAQSVHLRRAAHDRPHLRRRRGPVVGRGDRRPGEGGELRLAEPGGAGRPPTYVDPIFSYTHGNSDTQGDAITGGTFYNPANNQFGAAYQGNYFFADLTSNWIRLLNTSNNTATLFATGLPAATVDLDVDPAGNLYYLSRGTGSATGEVVRIDHGGVSPEQHYVAALYQDVLGRAGTAAEREPWVQQLATAGRGTVAAWIERSTEGLQHLVEGYYNYYLGRAADAGGLSNWVGHLQHGDTAEQVAGYFLIVAGVRGAGERLGGDGGRGRELRPRLSACCCSGRAARSARTS